MKARHVHIRDFGDLEMIELEKHTLENGKVFYTMDPETFDSKYRTALSYNVFVKEKKISGGYWYTNDPWTVIARMEFDHE